MTCAQCRDFGAHLRVRVAFAALIDAHLRVVDVPCRAFDAHLRVNITFAALLDAHLRVVDARLRVHLVFAAPFLGAAFLLCTLPLAPIGAGGFFRRVLTRRQ